MHDHWKSIISARTSSKDVLDAMVAQFGKIKELETDHDFQGQIAECIQSVTDWFSATSRSRHSLWENDFRSCLNILDLIATVAKEKRNWPSFFIPSFAEGDEETVYEVAGVGKISRLVTPEAITREIESRDIYFASDIHSVAKFSSKGPSEYWTARTADGELAAIGQTAGEVVLGVKFIAPESLRTAEDIVTAYIVDNQLPMITATAVSGMVFGNDGAFYRLAEMPAGLTIKGDVDLVEKPGDMDKWPEGVTVEGYLNVRGVGMRVSPPHLHVRGDLVWADDALEALGEGLVVEGNASFHCSDLGVAGDGCRFGGDLWVENVAILDQDFTVSGKVLTGGIKFRRQLEYPRRSLVKRLLRKN
jgi:hypothetical protein